MYVGVVVRTSFYLERDTKRIKAAFSVFPLCYTELVLLTQFCVKCNCTYPKVCLYLMNLLSSSLQAFRIYILRHLWRIRMRKGE